MDDALALRWYGAAAEQGHSEAQFNLAVFHANGWGVEMDGREAEKWYLLSADQGFVQAQITLAKNYHRGRGVAENLVEAYKWYEIARQFGDDEAQIGIEEVTEVLPAEQLAQAQELARQWLAAHAGLAKQ
jgi:TPR repeat protein